MMVVTGVMVMANSRSMADARRGATGQRAIGGVLLPSVVSNSVGKLWRKHLVADIASRP